MTMHGGEFDERVFVYAAGGYYEPGKSDADLQEELRGYVEQGFRQVKIKVGGAPLARDLERIEAALEVVGDGANLAVDVNGRFDLKEAVAFGEAIEGYRLAWYEEPCDPLDYLLHAQLAALYQPPLATGENLFSVQDATNLIRHGGLRPDRDVLQFDCALSYGLVEYLRILDMLRHAGWSPRRCIPHGGHQMSACIAAGLGLGGNEAYPGVFEPFGHFPESARLEDGYVTVPDLPGIGFEDIPELAALLPEPSD
jgi:D(-)-tartrate dehydratase